MKKYIYIIIAIVSFISCTKENDIYNEEQESYKGFKYRILLKDVSKPNANLEGLEIKMELNDSTYVLIADTSGMAWADNVSNGYAIVSFENQFYTDVHYMVDFYENPSENNKTPMTEISLIPIDNDNKASISGKLYADLDLTNPGYEELISDISIYAKIIENDMNQLIYHNGKGIIRELNYPDLIQTYNNNGVGEYSFSFPALLNGFRIELTSDDFEYNQVIEANNVQRKVFSLRSDTIKIFKMRDQINDLIFE